MIPEFQEIFDRIEAKFRAKKIPKLKTLFKGAVNNTANLTNLLVRKSLLKENMYNYSEEVSTKFFLLEEKAFMDMERSRVIFDRLKTFMNALDFLATSLEADLDTIDDVYIENAYKLLSYFAFHCYNSSNAGINTRTLKELTDKLLAGKDQILKRVVLDNLKLLSDNFNKTKILIDELASYKKEKYMALIRFNVFQFLPQDLNEKLLLENPSQYIKKLIKFMSINNPDLAVKNQWIVEAIKNCYSKNTKQHLEEIKKYFLSDDSQNTEGKISVFSPREKLKNIINFICTCNSPLEKIYIRFEENLKFLLEKKKGFFEELVKMFRNTKHKDAFFQLEYINPANKTIQNDTININDFMQSIKKKIILFKTILKDDSPINEKIKNSTEESLFKFIEETYFDLLLTKERIIGINGEIRLRVSKKSRQYLKEISEPIDSLDAILRKIGDQRRKYVIDHEKLFFKESKTEK